MATAMGAVTSTVLVIGGKLVKTAKTARENRINRTDEGRLYDRIKYHLPSDKNKKWSYETIDADGNYVKYTDKEAERNILSNPFKRFEDMNIMHHTKTLGIVEVDTSVWKRLSKDEQQEINKICDENLSDYFSRIK